MIILIMASAAATLVLVASAIQGTATFYTPPYVPSSCYGYNSSNSILIAAASEALWNNRTACGKIYSVRCSGAVNLSVPQPCKNNGYVKVTIVDYCPPPGCRGTIDLSQEAFAMIADPNAGNIKIVYTDLMSNAPASRRTLEEEDSPQNYLNGHNSARAAVGVQPMTWDVVVAEYAMNYANLRKSDCTLVHSGGPYGENLAWGSGNLSETDAMGMWVGENTNYDLRSNSCAARRVCGHYTQVIWATSIRLGCAKVECNDGAGTFIVCNYDPPGNIVGKRPTDDGNQSIIAVPPVVPPITVPRKERKDIKGLVVGLTVGACALILLGPGLICLIISRRIKRIKGNKLDDHEFRDGMAVSRKFSLVELAKMTSNFNGKKLGEGGFGAVYRGYLRDSGTYVAVKRISKASKQGIKEFTSEVKIISRLRHKNLIKLVGWCHEKWELILVYEFMEKGSLESHLFKGKSLLTWEVRYKIAQGLASALSYLHEEGDHCVLHRDIKTSNIMLDSSFNAKLGDFGLARLVDHAKGSQTTRLAGTMGYMAPEYVSLGKFNKESDVYSFGIVALEIASGRRSIEPNYEDSQASLVAWVWDSYGNQRLLDIADHKLCWDFDAKQMECLLIVGLWCVHPDPNRRPSIRQAIQVLNLESPLPELPNTRPPPTYGDVPNIAHGIKASEPCYPTLGVTVPR